MKVAKTIRHKILNHASIFDETIRVYNEALSFIIEVIDQEVEHVDAYSTKEMTNLIERLIHATKSNPTPKYTEFNQRFYKFPSYFRRAAIATAFGKVKSYRSLRKNWETEKQVALENGRKFNKQPPTKQFTHKEFPVLYKGNMFKRTSDTTACIKAFVNGNKISSTILRAGKSVSEPFMGEYNWEIFFGTSLKVNFKIFEYQWIKRVNQG